MGEACFKGDLACRQLAKQQQRLCVLHTALDYVLMDRQSHRTTEMDLELGGSDTRHRGQMCDREFLIEMRLDVLTHRIQL